MVIGRADGLVIRRDYSMFAYDKNFTYARVYNPPASRYIICRELKISRQNSLNKQKWKSRKRKISTFRGLFFFHRENCQNLVFRGTYRGILVPLRTSKASSNGVSTYIFICSSCKSDTESNHNTTQCADVCAAY